MVKKPTVLIVGGAGYIGAHTAKYFIKKSVPVIIIDDLSTGKKKFIDEKAKFIKADISNKEDIKKIILKLKKENISCVLHFASKSIVSESMKNPQEYYFNNIVGTLNILNLMRQKNINNIIFSSSAAVYGITKQIPIKENSVLKPINPYGNTKFIIETMLKDYSSAYKIKYVSLRYFNAAGAAFNLKEEHSPETHLIPVILNAVKKSTAVSIFGDKYKTRDGTAIRDYIHVLDLAKAHFLAYQYLLKKNSKNKIYNLGSGKGYSVKEIIKTVEKVTGKKVKTKIEKEREGDPPILIADYEKIKKELGWKPEFNLKDIVLSAWKAINQ